MSQPSPPYMSADPDPFLPTIELGLEEYSQAQIEELFGPNKADHPVFEAPGDNVLENLNFEFDEQDSFQNGSSTMPSNISTPDSVSYGFDPSSAVYSHPHTAANSPQAYPLDHHYQQLHDNQPQHPYQPHMYTPTNNHHPALVRRPHLFHANVHSEATSPHFFASNRAQTYTRRRSLSHNDADRIANPTFVRLQAPRARSATPEAKQRGGPYARHARSASSGPGPETGNWEQGGHYAACSNQMRMGQAGGMMFGGLLPTIIGKPLDAESNSEDAQEQDDIVVRYMTDATQLAQSRRVIEIGAMAVRRHDVDTGSIDPRLSDEGLSVRERVVRKLAEVERHLKADSEGGRNEDALRGCEMIREALKRRSREDDGAEGEGGKRDLDVPSKVMGDEGKELFGGELDENDLMGLLLRENEREKRDDDDE
ncbi:hypothetical protein FB567DRAFT_232707 [Paraphoma chrysanthemicola]|uniref:Uncharacterized protein n=1 Tax=Paraphoma chrysanthemicola TaxID=798071 RepID=A0A8K0RFL6_9PLEO|nr:hypothetical protein FB567DRAFT_232707 [Paraphoma chrysanthemicola]